MRRAGVSYMVSHTIHTMQSSLLMELRISAWFGWWHGGPLYVENTFVKVRVGGKRFRSSMRSSSLVAFSLGVRIILVRENLPDRMSDEVAFDVAFKRSSIA